MNRASELDRGAVKDPYPTIKLERPIPGRNPGKRDVILGAASRVLADEDVHALDQFLKQRLQTDWPAPKRKPKRPQSSLIRRPPTADSERPKPLTEQQRKRLAQKEA